MPDPLDPTNAIFGGVGDAVKVLFAFFLVTGGSAVLGMNFHEAPTFIAAVQSSGFNAITSVFSQFKEASPFLWLGMMLHSIVIWYLIPFLLSYLWLLGKVWRGDDLIETLLTLAVVHSVHTFLYLQRTDPLPPGDLIIGSAVLVVGEVAMVGLVLWWRNVRENAPLEEEETEPEL